MHKCTDSTHEYRLSNSYTCTYTSLFDMHDTKSARLYININFYITSFMQKDIARGDELYKTTYLAYESVSFIWPRLVTVKLALNSSFTSVPRLYVSGNAIYNMYHNIFHDCRQNMEFDRAVEQTTACQCLNDSANVRSSAMSSVHNTTYKCERRSGPGKINYGIMHQSASRVISLQMRNSKLFHGYSTKDSTGKNRTSHFPKYLHNCNSVSEHRLSWLQVQAVIVLVTLFLLCRPCLCSTPATFNVALNKPVYATPSNATCGYSTSTQQEAFCMSNTDPNYVEICEKSVCNLQCPSERGSLPHYENVFSTRVSGSTWSGCPYKNSTRSVYH